MNLKMFLELDADRMYDIQNLEEPAVIERSLRLVFAARFGQTETIDMLRASPYINYTCLSKNVMEEVGAKLATEEKDLAGRYISKINRYVLTYLNFTAHATY